MKKPFFIKKTNVSLRDLKTFANEIKQTFKKPQAVLLTGPLGVGKTTFIKTLLETENQNHPSISSPAFAIQNYYPAPVKAYHVDLYRLKNDEDLESTGLWDIFSETENLIFIEWANRFNKESLPNNWNYLLLQFSFTTNNEERNIQVQNF